MNFLIQNFDRSRMYSLYSAHVMCCHRCMFTENYNFNIFRIKWDSNFMITVISDHLINAQGRLSVYFFIHKLKMSLKWPCDCCKLLQQHIIMLAGLLLWCLKSLSIYIYIVIIISWHMQLCQFSQLAWKKIKLLICVNHSIQYAHPKFSTLSWSLIVGFWLNHSWHF